MSSAAQRRVIYKNMLYVLLVILCYLVQVTPGAVSLPVRPMPAIAAVVAIAMMEGGFSGGLYGLFGGLLCDTGAFYIFGVGSILFLILGCACGLCILYLMHPTARAAMLLAGAFALVYGIVAHYLLYGMWGYEGAAGLLLGRTLPSAALTALLGAPLFWLARLVHDRFGAEEQQTFALRGRGRSS